MPTLPKKKGKSFKVRAKTKKKVKASKHSSFILAPHHILPDFREIANLVRFTALLYILALLPLVGYLYQPKVASTSSTTYVAQRQTAGNSASVLGEKAKSLDVPKFPSWNVEYFSRQIEPYPLIKTIKVMPLVYIDEPQIRSYPVVNPSDLSTKLESVVNFETGLYQFIGSGYGNLKVYIDEHLLFEVSGGGDKNAYIHAGPHKVTVEYNGFGSVLPFSLDWRLK